MAYAGRIRLAAVRAKTDEGILAGHEDVVRINRLGHVALLVGGLCIAPDRPGKSSAVIRFKRKSTPIDPGTIHVRRSRRRDPVWNMSRTARNSALARTPAAPTRFFVRQVRRCRGPGG